MATVIYPSPIFGPVHSRRLGVSLGINLLPADGKFCPDTVLRVYMAWKALDVPVEIESQELVSPERVGFTVVEWGGSEVK